MSWRTMKCHTINPNIPGPNLADTWTCIAIGIRDGLQSWHSWIHEHKITPQIMISIVQILWIWDHVVWTKGEDIVREMKYHTINPNIPNGIRVRWYSHRKVLLWPWLVPDYQTTGHHPMLCSYTRTWAHLLMYMSIYMNHMQSMQRSYRSGRVQWDPCNGILTLDRILIEIDPHDHIVIVMVWPYINWHHDKQCDGVEGSEITYPNGQDH